MVEDPRVRFVEQLTELRALAGQPSLEALVRADRQAVAETTSSAVLARATLGDLLTGKGVKAPRWELVEAFVRACRVIGADRLRHLPAELAFQTDIDLWRNRHRNLVDWLEGRSRDEVPDQSERAFVVAGTSTAVPDDPGPAVAHGRDDVVTRLVDLLVVRDRDHAQVLVGAGGMGKSTIARLVAAKACRNDPKRHIWWISAVNEEHLSGGLISLARQLGASTADQEAIRTHTVADLGDIADRIWYLLDESEPGWLLVIDNADDPNLLGPPNGRGWIRTANAGLLLVTSRNSNEFCWPGGVEFTPIGPLSAEAATDVLTDLAPHAGSRAAARDLAIRLGCLPLALRMAGMYLRRDFVAWPTFAEYRQALDIEGIAQVIEASQRAEPLALITQTWELSLDALEKAGLPQARSLLWLLSCYAPGSSIPADVVIASDKLVSVRQRARDRHPLAKLLDPDQVRTRQLLAQDCLDGLNGLGSFSLVQAVRSHDQAGQIELHPFIAEVTQTVLNAGRQGSVDPLLVRNSAVTAIGEAVRKLDVGRVEHWPRFHALTPHVQELLTSTAPHLGMRWRRDLLDCMTLCISSYVWSRAEPRAEQLAAEALERGRFLGCADSPAYLRLRYVQAWAIRDQDRFAEAAVALRQVLAAQRRLPGGATRADTLRTRHELGWTFGRLGQWADAEVELRQVLREWRARRQHRGLRGDDSFILHTRCKLCWCVGKQGHWDVAERDYRHLLDDRAAILGPDHADTLDTMESLGKAMAWQGKWAEAQAEFHRLAVGRARKLGERHPDALLAHQLETYAAGYQAALRNDRDAQRTAVARLEQILRHQEFVRGVEHRNTLDSRAFLAILRGTYSPNLSWTDDLPRPQIL
jgi:hypothetical protein